MISRTSKPPTQTAVQAQIEYALEIARIIFLKKKAPKEHHNRW